MKWSNCHVRWYFLVLLNFFMVSIDLFLYWWCTDFKIYCTLLCHSINNRQGVLSMAKTWDVWVWGKCVPRPLPVTTPPYHVDYTVCL